MNFRAVPLLLALLVLAACNPPSSAPTAPANNAPSASDAVQAKGTAPADAASDADGNGMVIRDTTAATPTLSVPTVDGKSFDLAQHRGRWVVVNFWATWCGPCLKEMPELSALDAMREDVDVIGLAYEDITVEEMNAFLKEHPVVYPIAIVDVMSPPADFATPRGLPMTYLINPAGGVARQFAGPVSAQDIQALIAEAKPSGG